MKLLTQFMARIGIKENHTATYTPDPPTFTQA